MLRRISSAEFIAQYQSHFERIERFYRRAYIAGISTKSHFSGFEGIEVMKHEYRSNGACLRVDSSFLDRKHARRWTSLVSVASPCLSFEAAMYIDEDTYTLTRFERDGTKADTSIRWNFPFASSAYQYRDLTMLEFLRQPNVEIVGVETLVRDGEKLCRLECQQPRIVPQSFVFSIDKGWPLVETSSGGEERVTRSRFDYDYIRGLPIIRRCEESYEFADGRVSIQEVVEIADFVPSPAAEDEFEPSAIGIHGQLPTKDFGT